MKLEPPAKARREGNGIDGASGAHSVDLAPSKLCCCLPQSGGPGHRRARPSATARDLRPATLEAAPLAPGSSLLGCPLAPMASVEERPRDRATRDRRPMAPAPLPLALAIDLYPRAGKASTRGGDPTSNHPDGHREPLARAEDPRRALEARNPGEPRHDLALPAQGPAGSWPAAPLDHLPSESPRSDRRHGLLVRFQLLYVWFAIDHGRSR